MKKIPGCGMRTGDSIWSERWFAIRKMKREAFSLPRTCLLRPAYFAAIRAFLRRTDAPIAARPASIRAYVSGSGIAATFV